MKYAVEIASSGMTYIPSFIKIDSGFQTLLGGRQTQTHRQRSCFIGPLYFFFQNDESRLRMRVVLNGGTSE